MAYYFDEAYYISAKLAQMASIGTPMTEPELRSAIEAVSMTVQEHYEMFGRQEGLNPNPYFNEYEYLQAKTAQLNSVGEPNWYGDGPWTVEQTLQAMTDVGMTPAEHYAAYGAFETDAKGNFINPSNAFDANAYYAAKLYQLQHTDPDGGWTLENMLEAFQQAALDPIDHYAAFGADEADAAGIAFVETVPMEQRVSNDPARDDVTGHTVPANYNHATPPPDDTGVLPLKPADVGGLADERHSPAPIFPDKSLPVPGDADYHAAPPNIEDLRDGTVLPPTGDDAGKASGNWLVLDKDGTAAIVVGQDGAIKGLVPIQHDPHGGFEIADGQDKPLGDLAAVPPDDLPGYLSVVPGLNNNVHDTPTPPPPDYSGILAVFDPHDDLQVSGTIKASGESSVTLDEHGTISWDGQKNGAVPPTGLLLEDHTLNASAVTGNGVLKLETSFTSEHAIIGSATAKNEVTVNVGAKVESITTGTNDDTFNINGTSGTENETILNGGKGNDTFNVTNENGEVEHYIIDGGEGHDSLNIADVNLIGTRIELSVKGIEECHKEHGNTPAISSVNMTIVGRTNMTLSGDLAFGSDIITVNAPLENVSLTFDAPGAAIKKFDIQHAANLTITGMTYNEYTTKYELDCSQITGHASIDMSGFYGAVKFIGSDQDDMFISGGGKRVTGNDNTNPVEIHGGKGADTIDLTASATPPPGEDMRYCTLTYTLGDSEYANYDSVIGFRTDAASGAALFLPPKNVLADVTSGHSTGITDVTYGAKDGIITFTGKASLEQLIEAALSGDHIGSATSTAAFEYGGDTYVIQGDGVAGAGADDLVIKLVGVTGVTALGDTAADNTIVLTDHVLGVFTGP
ncbi:MAG: hypothetical protein LUG19_03245 [Desulfovibrio sp.]|uniref:hypothetical protein n=1 Tax=Desulfovibrio sp. TaxID=885 RepID=UPI00258F7264|nr:hypothetical protein [Desulfovibrio sp.]MCD7983255.1 hypothetical protein [Desulfovibrio sp.]